MAALIRMNLDTPEEIRPFEDGKGRVAVGEPRFRARRASNLRARVAVVEHVKPIAKTESCQAAHMGYYVSGRMKVVMDDGEEIEYGPGDFAVIPPGHDAWIVGGRTLRSDRLAGIR